MSIPSPYNKEFYESMQEGVRQSAREIIPLILELIQPQSVVDVGCGIGTWLSIFKEFGIQDCLGIDGDYVNQEQLQISSDEFLACDLKSPLPINKTFDLVLSLEVAEHLPSTFAENFVDSLTKLGSFIVFSAAIPHQGGVHHVNEQWPDYWSVYFQEKGYLLIDYLRKKIWNNAKVESWYAQNILIFVKQDCLDNYPSLQRELQNTNLEQLSIVHPKVYLKNVADIIARTQQYTPIEQPPAVTPTGTELRLNENRFGSLEVEIIAVHLLDLEGSPVKELDSGASLRIEMEYLTTHPIHAPIFSVTLSREDGLVCYDTNTIAAELTIETLQGRGRITLYLERLDLNSGQYYIDIGAYEQNWDYAYDYHWHVYPLVICSKTNEKGVLCPPRHWEIIPMQEPTPESTSSDVPANPQE